jgi:hypothetical protein
MMIGTKAILLILTICSLVLVLFASDERLFFSYIQLFCLSILGVLIVVELVIIRIVWKVEKT